VRAAEVHVLRRFFSGQLASACLLRHDEAPALHQAAKDYGATAIGCS
jgi:hypothetical protein